MGKKKNMDNLIAKYQPVLKKTGDQLAKAVKVAEKDLAKMYVKAQTHLEIQMKNLQKEKLYYDIGKYVAGRLASGELDAAGLEKYRKQLARIDAESRKMGKKLTAMDKAKSDKPENKAKGPQAE